MITIRPATERDAEAVAAIYNHGIQERQATFETRPRRPNEIVGWLEEGRPFLVATDETSTILGFARVSAYSIRKAYAGRRRARRLRQPGRPRPRRRPATAERARPGRGAGAATTSSPAASSRPTRPASNLHRAAGFREVGVQRHHGQLDGEWKDTMLVERLLGEAARG